MEERLRQLEAQLEEKNQELLRVRRMRVVLTHTHTGLSLSPHVVVSPVVGAAAGEDERGAQQASV